MSITFKNLSHIYNEKTPFPSAALKNINLEIADGSFTAIIGETGSGKSTLVQHLNALLLPTDGEVRVNDFVIKAGEKIKDLKQLRRQVGLVFQFPEYQLFEETIETDVAFGPKNFGIEEKEAKERARYVLELVGLDASYLERSPFDLSGGQKRRVAIAGILAFDPDVLVLDEPTAGLDPQGAKEMMDLFKKLNTDFGKTIIMVTHDMEHVLNYCDEVILLKKGEVELVSDVKNFFKDSTIDSLDVQPPHIVEFKRQLEARGFAFDEDAFDLPTLVQSLKGEFDHE
ncbi:energy-coupling factor transport system ATP-binding protein [Breznakia blatticola]|uniref:Energy-coupling factor transporter ATP-binding protein EcfA2 n=1 Tax=Breznakia blatticola TaxID=1754012 RepID=A0A4R8A2V2_9FIRM|nr:energy-coupling factor transporter ATPase [Breznakia blatticola]TDW24899.1 energy-coupling factor transport system ATP-binding protein [Breznakia blatticola]